MSKKDPAMQLSPTIDGSLIGRIRSPTRFLMSTLVCLLFAHNTYHFVQYYADMNRTLDYYNISPDILDQSLLAYYISYAFISPAADYVAHSISLRLAAILCSLFNLCACISKLNTLNPSSPIVINVMVSQFFAGIAGSFLYAMIPEMAANWFALDEACFFIGCCYSASTIGLLVAHFIASQSLDNLFPLLMNLGPLVNFMVALIFGLFVLLFFRSFPKLPRYRQPPQTITNQQTILLVKNALFLIIPSAIIHSVYYSYIVVTPELLTIAFPIVVATDRSIPQTMIVATISQSVAFLFFGYSSVNNSNNQKDHKTFRILLASFMAFMATLAACTHYGLFWMTTFTTIGTAFTIAGSMQLSMSYLIHSLYQLKRKMIGHIFFILPRILCISTVIFNIGLLKVGIIPTILFILIPTCVAMALMLFVRKNNPKLNVNQNDNYYADDYDESEPDTSYSNDDNDLNIRWSRI